MILVASPVRQPPAVLEAFLAGLAGLRPPEGQELRYMFVDDCDDPRSGALLERWRPAGGRRRVVVWRLEEPGPRPAFRRDEITHHWTPRLAARVGAARSHLLNQARRLGAQGCLLVDSDLVLQPQTLETLWAADRDIVSEVYWTRFAGPDDPPLPNVWLWGEYGLAPVRPEEAGVTHRQLARRASAFLEELRQPGLHRVGGLGGCTLIRRRALTAGFRLGGRTRHLDYTPIPGLGWWGEDRHFCVRAQALGLELWAHSGCAPRHLYRPGDLAEAPRGGGVAARG